MRYFRKNFTKDIYSLNDIKTQKIIDSFQYQNFLRKNLIDTKEKNITPKHFENIFTNEIYYRAMKNLLPIEKEILYLAFYENYSLQEICKITKKSKTEIIILKNNTLNKLKQNYNKYSSILSRKGGVKNG